MIKIVNADRLFMQEENMPLVELAKEDYLTRVELFVERLKERGLSHGIIYGDREHFSNVEYFTHYDCRFEETLLIISDKGQRWIVAGNEGMGFSKIIPYEIERLLYQNFSLQGQPRDQSLPLHRILETTGIGKESKIGITGFKYFENDGIYDVPQYIMNEIQQASSNICNITEELTGLPNGIRMSLHSAKEIAWAESAGNKTAAVMQRMFKNLRPGIREYELPEKAKVGFDALSAHPLCNFGEESVEIGMGSPRDRELQIGEVCGMCYSLRGNLTSRVSVAAYDLQSCKEEIKPFIDSFYKKHFEAMANWYETAVIGATGGQLYEAVMSIIGAEEFGVGLNPGHNGGCDEWTNSPCFSGSEIPIADGAFMQVDIIASASNPIRTAICEDAVVFAGEKLRTDLQEQYPEVYQRIVKRQEVMREVLGIQMSDEILPMSNLNGVNYPFMLDTTKVFGKISG